VSELPITWTTTPLLKAIELHDSRRIPLNASERAKRKGSYPYYGANGLVDHVDDYIFDGEYVLLAEDGGNFDKPERGVAYEVSGKFWVNNHAHILKPRGEMPPRLLRYWLNAIDWMPYVGGTTRAKLTQAGMAQVSIPIPPLSEQRRIVAKLDSLTGRTARAREELGRIPRLIRKYKETLLSAAFGGDFCRPEDRDGFETRPFSYAIQSTFYGPRFSKDSYDADGVMTLRTTDFDDAGNIRPKSPPAVKVSEKDFEKWGLIDGDLLVTRTGSIGKCAVYSSELGPALPSAYLIRTRLNKAVIRPRFALLFLISPSGQDQLGLGITAVTQPNINASVIDNLKLPIPCLRVQDEIIYRIETAFVWLDRITAEHANACRLLPKLDQAILAKAFRGELVPQDQHLTEPNITPAAKEKAVVLA
jgi:type I restriction enzyme S subunit